MQTIPSIANLVGLKVKHGSPGYEELEVIDDVAFFQATGRAHVIFESGFQTNMTEAELGTFMLEGEVSYLQRFGSDSDVGQTVLKLAEY